MPLNPTQPNQTKLNYIVLLFLIFLTIQQFMKTKASGNLYVEHTTDFFKNHGIATQGDLVATLIQKGLKRNGNTGLEFSRTFG